MKKNDVNLKQNFIDTLKGKTIRGHVPHFELVFFLTMEVLGKVHPQHRNYEQWNQMSKSERRLHLLDMAHCYVDIAERYSHGGILIQDGPFEHVIPLLETIREIGGDKYCIMLHGDPSMPIPDGQSMVDFSVKMYENPELIQQESMKKLDDFTKGFEKITKIGGLLDGVCLCSDYCLNTNPFYSRDMFADLIAPYLAKGIQNYRDMGLVTIKHTDGNVMPILDMIVECNPDGIHSLDPQGNVDLKEVRKLYGKKVCLIGNVNCGKLQTGSTQEVIDDVRRALRDGMSDGNRYIFSTSNCVYTGLDLERYELMHDIWVKEGIYND